MPKFITLTWNCEPSSVCVICGRDNYKSFPEDFPEEWKFCCLCLTFAEIMIRDGNRWSILEHYRNYGYIDKLNKTLDKIEKCITLVG